MKSWSIGKLTRRYKMEYVFNDGGRAAAGRKGYTRDCVCRAVVIASGKPYQDGVINDIYDPSRNETRCVYGYWKK